MFLPLQVTDKDCMVFDEWWGPLQDHSYSHHAQVTDQDYMV